MTLVLCLAPITLWAQDDFLSDLISPSSSRAAQAQRAVNPWPNSSEAASFTRFQATPSSSKLESWVGGLLIAGAVFSLFKGFKSPRQYPY